MANQSKTKTVKFEIGQFVLFSGHRVGRVSRIAKNGGVYVNVLGETTVADPACEELRVKKADLRHVSDMMAATGDHATEWDYVSNMIRASISRKVTARVELTEAGVYGLAPDYIPSPNCLEYCEWKGSEADASVMHNFGIDLAELANLYTGKLEAASVEPQLMEVTKGIEEPARESSETFVDAAQEIVVEESPAEPVESAEPAQSELEFPQEESQSVANAKYALRELTFSVTRHSILTAFIDVALNKNIAGYHHQVASNLKNLMAAAFDPVHDAGGYARINTWTMAALELVVKHKERVAKMLNQPIEAAQIKVDRVTKLGMWIDNMMNREGHKVNDMTSAYDSCYVYDSWTKKVGACVFVVVELVQAMDRGEAGVIPLPCTIKSKQYQEYMTAQSAIARRKQCIDFDRPTEPDLHLYCGIVPVYKTGLSMQAAIEDTLADVIGSLK